ncbi:MAG: hypothetical protein WDO19_09520 [Bacteroidota bacterium]
MKKIAPDKWKHFYAGIILGSVSYWLSSLYWPLHPVIPFVVSMGTIVAVSYGFELFSLWTGKGHYEIMDAVAGIIGGVVGIGVAFFSKFIFHY